MSKFKDIIDAAEYMQQALIDAADAERYCESTRELLEHFCQDIGNVKSNLMSLEGHYGIL